MSRPFRVAAVLGLALAAAPGVILFLIAISLAALADALQGLWRRFSSFPNPD